MSDPLTPIESTATTEAEKLRTELTTELATLESSLRADLAKARAQFATPHGHMMFGIMLFAGGMAATLILQHL